jgi:hypothetical protein
MIEELYSQIGATRRRLKTLTASGAVAPTLSLADAAPVAEGTMKIDKAAPGPMGGASEPPVGKPRSLGELASDLDPESYAEWQSARQAMANAIWIGDAGLGSRVEDRGPQLYRNQRSGAQKAQQSINDASAKLNAAIRGAIASLHYRTEGVGPPGTMSDVPRDISDELVVDIEAGKLATAAGWVWTQVTVTRSAVAAKSQVERQPKRVDRKDLQRLTRQLIEEIYDGSMPPSYITTPAVQERLAAEKNHNVGLDTIRRARGLKS